MNCVDYESKKIAVDIIEKTFDVNPSVNIVIGAGGNRQKKIRRLAPYAFIKGINRSGTFISTNKKGVAICFKSDEGAGNLEESIEEMRFALSIPFKKIIQTLKRESYIKKNRYDERHLYFWCKKRRR